MRATHLVAAVVLAVLLSTTPGSSWSPEHRPKADERGCLPAHAISLFNGSASVQIALISSQGCGR